VRSIETKQELPIPSYESFANDDQLLKAALNRMLYGLSSRDYGYGIENYSDVAEVSGISKSSIGSCGTVKTVPYDGGSCGTVKTVPYDGGSSSRRAAVFSQPA